MTLQAPIGSARAEAAELLTRLGVAEALWTGGGRPVRSPVTGEIVAEVHDTAPAAVAQAVEAAHEAYLAWRAVPAPRRGELVRLLGEELRTAKADLARLVTLEAGKIVSEANGEVQEMIDICDYATGLSRQLFGLTIATERPEHRMMETWHPLGVVGVVSAFNFPVAVWSWNAALALVCGDAVVWKPSEKTPLTALAVQALLDRAMARFGDAPVGLSAVIIGGREVGEALVDHPRVPLVSATGSTAMGRAVAPRLADAREAGGRITGGERIEVAGCPNAIYVRPALVEMESQADVVRRETFAPILYVMRYSDLEEAIRLQNDVPQGLSSSIFTNDIREAELFTSARGSDCGIANVNIGPSGAEIGGAFGGEKETGGGREAGSDSWRTYMRRATNTVNYGATLPLAQGVEFDV
jgi:acyl-CoA reductase-like NAD-dependent aldehyde dehydrogenase